MHLILTVAPITILYLFGFYATVFLIRRWELREAGNNAEKLIAGQPNHGSEVTLRAMVWPVFWTLHIMAFLARNILLLLEFLARNILVPLEFLWKIAYGEKEAEKLRISQQVAKRLRDE